MYLFKVFGLLLFITTLQVVVAQNPLNAGASSNGNQPAYRPGMVFLKIKDDSKIYLPKFKKGDKFDNYPVLQPFMES